MEYEFVETQKGGRALLTKGYRYLRYIEQDKRLQKLKERMTDATVSINECVSAVAHWVRIEILYII